jgi:hypothetical protein
MLSRWRRAQGWPVPGANTAGCKKEKKQKTACIFYKSRVAQIPTLSLKGNNSALRGSKLTSYCAILPEILPGITIAVAPVTLTDRRHHETQYA